MRLTQSRWTDKKISLNIIFYCPLSDAFCEEALYHSNIKYHSNKKKKKKEKHGMMGVLVLHCVGRRDKVKKFSNASVQISLVT